MMQKIVGTLVACDSKGISNQYVEEGKCVVENNSIRRLTPIECERLQGLEDGYSDVLVNGKPVSDAARYKALGNGMAIPSSNFVMDQIVRFVGMKK